MLKVRDLLVASLNIAVVCTGCTLATSSCPDDPEPQPFDLDEEITSETLRQLEQELARQPTCEDVCKHVSWRSQPDIQRCALTEPTPSTETAQGTPGRIECAGRGIPICEGRRPLGHVEAREHAYSPDLGSTLAAAAHLEAASVVAFAQLARQLRAWGAPTELIAGCEAAREDEIAHARLVGRLARREGASVPRVERVACAEDRLQVALQNVAEGCVGETWAALLAFLKAERAHDPELRAAYARIAEDEARHAQLSWELHAWLRATLTAEERAALDAALQKELARLPSDARLHARHAPRAFGLPEPAALACVAHDLIDRVQLALAA